MFYLGRFADPKKTLSRLTIEDFDEPMLYFLLACLVERKGDEDAASRLFMTANQLDARGGLCHAA
jgi:Flp pilus assembly protein TadD